MIALQEVDGPDAAALVFPDYAFCFTRREHVQNVGFAVRPGLPFRCADYAALALGGEGLRWGAELTAVPGQHPADRAAFRPPEVGLPDQVLTNRRDDCRRLRRAGAGAGALDRRARGAGRSPSPCWATSTAASRASGTPHATAIGKLVAMWPELDDGDPPEADLFNAGADHGAIGCNNGHGVRMPIDHIVLGRKLTRRLVAGSFRVWDYPVGPRWPDHCVISTELDLEARHGL